MVFVVMASRRLLRGKFRSRCRFRGHRGLLTALRDGSIILTGPVSTDGQFGNIWLSVPTHLDGSRMGSS